MSLPMTAFHLPVAPKDWPTDELIATMRRDKKAQAGQLRFVLPTKLGEVAVFDDVSVRDVLHALKTSD